jgi:hypothetical protein
MFELFAIGFLLCAGAVVAGSILAVGVLLKILLRLVLLPLLLLKWLIGGVVLFLVGPVLALAGLIVMFVVGAVLALPLLPFVLLGLLVWALVRSPRRPAVI